MLKMYNGKEFSPPTFLALDLGAADVQLILEDASVLPPPPNRLTVWNKSENKAEVIDYEEINENVVLGLTRGVGGTAIDFTTDSIVFRSFSDVDYTTLIDNILELEETKQPNGDYATNISVDAKISEVSTSATQYTDTKTLEVSTNITEYINIEIEKETADRTTAINLLDDKKADALIFEKGKLQLTSNGTKIGHEVFTSATVTRAFGNIGNSLDYQFDVFGDCVAVRQSSGLWEITFTGRIDENTAEPRYDYFSQGFSIANIKKTLNIIPEINFICSKNVKVYNNSMKIIRAFESGEDCLQYGYAIETSGDFLFLARYYTSIGSKGGWSPAIPELYKKGNYIDFTVFFQEV